ncbi:hypothetical protein [Rhodovulum sp. ES.010]|uniref:hypothetical protein n=1 Tax=Rhodovulum sp. ES.010 TaxID=1882821 RepID=UPI00158803D4|nr:hypothetical protein [Rhodovulum sp. ES.010]
MNRKYPFTGGAEVLTGRWTGWMAGMAEPKERRDEAGGAKWKWRTGRAFVSMLFDIAGN